MYEWKAEYEVGHPLIDAQHKCLMTMTQDLMIELRKGTQTINIDDQLNILYKYADEHFVAEEVIMKEHDYPELQKHIEEHELFRNQLKELSNKNDSQSKDGFMAIAQFTMKWVLNHILRSDMAYKPYLKG